jgi:phosphoserine aminotransferase
VVKDVFRVVAGLDIDQSVVDILAISVADPVEVFIGTEEVDVDAIAVFFEGGEKALGPSGVSVGIVVFRPPHAVESDGV